MNRRRQDEPMQDPIDAPPLGWAGRLVALADTMHPADGSGSRRIAWDLAAAALRAPGARPDPLGIEPDGAPEPNPCPASAPRSRAASTRDRCAAYLAEHPRATNADVQRAVGCSVQPVTQARKRLEVRPGT